MWHQTGKRLHRESLMAVTHADTFLLNPKNASFVSRDTDRIGSSRTIALIVVVALIVGIGMLASQITSYVRDQDIAASGIRVNGTVIDSRTSGGGGGTVYYLTIRYPVDENPYSFEQQVSRDTFSDAPTGTAVLVGYRETDAQTAVLADQWRDDTRHVNGLTSGAIMAGIAVTITVALVRADLKNRRLSAHGHFLRAQLLEAKTYRNRGGITLEVRYSFVSPEGISRTQKARASRDDLRDKPLPAPGSSLLVLYVDERTFRLM